MTGHQRHRLWLAHIIHRISGLVLVLFLPVHFIMLSQALRGSVSFDAALTWTDHVFFKIAEGGLVFLLAVHLFGGIRLLVLEWVAPSSTSWTEVHKTLAAAAVALAFGVSMLFLLRAI